MKVAIIGLAQSGKSTVFLSLTGAQPASPDKGPGIQVGNVKVPDVRLDRLTEIFKPRKTVQADIDFLDVIGPRTEQGGAGLTSDVITEIRNADALIAVTADFENPSVVHPLDSIDALRDIKEIDIELNLTDLQQAEKRIKKMEKERTTGLEKDAVVRVAKWLEEEKPLRLLDLSDTEEKLLFGYKFLSQKPLLQALNVGEDKIGKPVDAAIVEYAAENHHSLMQYCAEIEREISELEPEEQVEFLEELGLEDSGKARFIRKVYEIVRLISFLTVGEDEVRAWSVPLGIRASKAAGKIHSDIERGFIRAETINYEEFIRLGSMKAARDGGNLRLEGKDYEIRDGDIISFRFNV